MDIFNYRKPFKWYPILNAFTQHTYLVYAPDKGAVKVKCLRQY